MDAANARHQRKKFCDLAPELIELFKGVASREQLNEVGLTNAELSDWKRNGSLNELMPGFFHHGNAEWMDVAKTSLLWGGESSALCLGTAAAIHGLPGFAKSGEIHLALQGRRKTPKRTRIPLKIHYRRKVCPLDVETVDGWRVTSVERTLLDLANHLSMDKLESLIDEAMRLKITDAKKLRAARERLSTKGRKGAAHFSFIIDTRGDTLVRMESPAEVDFMKFCADHRLDLPTAQRWIREPDRCYRTDFAYEQERIAIEIQSEQFHFNNLLQWRDDMTKENDLVSWEWTVLKFSPWHVKQKPRWVTRIVRDTLQLKRRQMELIAKGIEADRARRHAGSRN